MQYQRVKNWKVMKIETSGAVLKWFIRYDFFSFHAVEWTMISETDSTRTAKCLKQTLNQMNRSQLQAQINCSGIEMELHRQSDGNCTKESWEFLACAASRRMPTTRNGVSWNFGWEKECNEEINYRCVSATCWAKRDCLKCLFIEWNEFFVLYIGTRRKVWLNELQQLVEFQTISKDFSNYLLILSGEINNKRKKETSTIQSQQTINV